MKIATLRDAPPPRLDLVSDLAQRKAVFPAFSRKRSTVWSSSDVRGAHYMHGFEFRMTLHS
jgi:hypothetical protein